MGFGRASHDDLAQMAGHLSADTGDALGRRRDIAARSRATPAGSCEAAERRLDEAEQRVSQPAAYTDVSAILVGRRGPRLRWSSPTTCPALPWRPLYDLTLDGEQLAVSYLAEVTQQTGEDWPAVELGPGHHAARPVPGPARAGSLVHREGPCSPPAMPRMTHRAMAFTAVVGCGAATQAAPRRPTTPEAAVLMAEPSDAGG